MLVIVAPRCAFWTLWPEELSLIGNQVHSGWRSHHPDWSCADEPKSEFRGAHTKAPFCWPRGFKCYASVWKDNLDSTALILSLKVDSLKHVELLTPTQSSASRGAWGGLPQHAALQASFALLCPSIQSSTAGYMTVAAIMMFLSRSLCYLVLFRLHCCICQDIRGS